MFKPLSHRLLQAWLIALLLLGSTAGQAADTLTLNFKETDIHEVIEAVSRFTGKNFIIDTRVKGRVTVISSAPMQADAVYETFLSILQVYGYAAIPSGDVIKIFPENNAKQTGDTATIGATPGDQLVTVVVQLEHVSAPQLVPILRPLVPQYGHLAAYAASNILIVSDRAANVTRIRRLIRRIDKGGDDGVEVITLEHASAVEVVSILTKLTGSKKAKDPTAGELELVADPRTNSVLVGGDRSLRVKTRALIAHLDTPLDNDGDTQVIYLKHANAENLQKVLAEYIRPSSNGGDKKGEGRPEGGSSIVADMDTNSLVITAPPKAMREIRGVIDRLDIRRAQVMVEAIIAEMSEDASRDLGVALQGGPPGSVVISDFGSALGVSITQVVGALGALAGDNDPSNDGDLSGLSVPAGLTGGGVVQNSRGQLVFAGLLRALQVQADTTILSTPNLLALDNQEAEIKVGQEVPFVTGQFTSTGANDGASNPFQTIQREDVGISLKITPHVVDQYTVQLEIEQESSSIAGSAAGLASDIVTNKREIKTTVVVESGAIIALGGLIDNQTVETERKVPLLGDIPILGFLFRSTSKQKTRRNLVVFLRTVILKDGADLQRYSATRYEMLRRFDGMAEEVGIDISGTRSNARAVRIETNGSPQPTPFTVEPLPPTEFAPAPTPRPLAAIPVMTPQPTALPQATAAPTPESSGPRIIFRDSNSGRSGPPSRRRGRR